LMEGAMTKNILVGDRIRYFDEDTGEWFRGEIIAITLELWNGLTIPFLTIEALNGELRRICGEGMYLEAKQFSVRFRDAA
jgi:hypothetical protein